MLGLKLKPGAIAPGQGRLEFPIAALAIGAIASAMLFLGVRESIENGAKLRFERQASDAKHVIEARIKSYFDVLYGLRALFSKSSALSQLEFHRYVAALDLLKSHAHKHTDVHHQTLEPFGTVEGAMNEAAMKAYRMAHAEGGSGEKKKDNHPTPGKEQWSKDERAKDEGHVPNGSRPVPLETAAGRICAFKAAKRANFERTGCGLARCAHLSSSSMGVASFR